MRQVYDNTFGSNGDSFDGLGYFFAQYRFTVAAKPHLQKTMLLSMQNVKAVEGFMM